MKTFWQYVQLAFSTIASFVVWLVGDNNEVIVALIVFMAFDYATGIISAVVNKKLSSAIGFKGILKKVLIFLIVGMANIVDRFIFSNTEMLLNLVVFFYLSNEGISILENITLIGLPVPVKLKNILHQIKGKDDDTK